MSKTREKKVFTFSGFAYNAGVADEINNWLAQNTNIVIQAIQVQTFMNKNIPLNWETVPTRVEISYERSDVRNFYTYHFFKSQKYIGCGYDTVERKRDEWAVKNTDKKLSGKNYVDIRQMAEVRRCVL